MKIKPYRIVLTFAAILLMAQPAIAVEKQGDFNNMLDSLSNILSSTNPKPANYKSIEPAAGEEIVDPQAATRARIANLPPLSPPMHSGPSTNTPAIIAPVAENPPATSAPVAIAAPQVDYERLSPETQRILQATPSGIGSHPQQRAEKIMIKRGEFDPEYGDLLDGPIDKSDPNTVADPSKIRKGAAQAQAAAPTEPVKARYDIKLQNARSEDTQISTLEKALRALNAGQYEVSIAMYKSVLDKDGRNRDALFGLATAYHKAGQKSQARDAYARLLMQYPTYQPGLNNLLVLASSEAPADALKELDDIGSRNPNFAPVYAQKASIYAQTGDFANAKKNFNKALAIEPDNIVYRYNMAILLDKSGDTVNAAKLYSQILEQSARGAKLPVERSEIEERLAYIGSLRASKS